MAKGTVGNNNAQTEKENRNEKETSCYFLSKHTTRHDTTRHDTVKVKVVVSLIYFYRKRVSYCIVHTDETPCTSIVYTHCTSVKSVSTRIVSYGTIR